jgi:hypothetical protein
VKQGSATVAVAARQKMASQCGAVDRTIQSMVRCPFSLERVLRVSPDGNVVHWTQEAQCRPFAFEARPPDSLAACMTASEPGSRRWSLGMYAVSKYFTGRLERR